MNPPSLVNDEVNFQEEYEKEISLKLLSKISFIWDETTAGNYRESHGNDQKEEDLFAGDVQIVK